MGDEPLEDEAGIAETLRESTAHVARSLELLDRLLASTEFNPEPAAFSIVDSLRFVAALHRLNHSGVALDFEDVLAHPLPAVCGVDHEIELVLLNLLLNSLAALDGRSGARIVVSALHVGGEVRITFEDDGPGIVPDLQARMFEPGVSGWGTEASPGLGLAASRALAESQGGSLVLARHDGPGACFLLTLPAMASQEGSAAGRLKSGNQP